MTPFRRLPEVVLKTPHVSPQAPPGSQRLAGGHLVGRSRTFDAVGEISDVRWGVGRRQAREARSEARREELRQAVLRLMSNHDCRVQQGDDWIEVRGDPPACRFRIDLPDDSTLLDAGDEGE